MMRLVQLVEGEPVKKVTCSPELKHKPFFKFLRADIKKILKANDLALLTFYITPYFNVSSLLNCIFLHVYFCSYINSCFLLSKEPIPSMATAAVRDVADYAVDLADGVASSTQQAARSVSNTVQNTVHR